MNDVPVSKRNKKKLHSPRAPSVTSGLACSRPVCRLQQKPLEHVHVAVSRLRQADACSKSCATKAHNAGIYFIVSYFQSNHQRDPARVRKDLVYYLCRSIKQVFTRNFTNTTVYVCVQINLCAYIIMLYGTKRNRTCSAPRRVPEGVQRRRTAQYRAPLFQEFDPSAAAAALVRSDVCDQAAPLAGRLPHLEAGSHDVLLGRAVSVAVFVAPVRC